MFSPSKTLVKSTYYIDDSLFNEYNVKVVKLRSKEKSVDRWSLLYKRQEGLCCVCGQSLGYLTSENFEIYHLKRASQLDVDDFNLKDINNLQLVHKSCHKTTLKIKE
jgi:hypothetical protein